MGVVVSGCLFFFSYLFVSDCFNNTLHSATYIRSRMATFQFGKLPKWEESQMAGAQHARGRVGLCAAKPVHARPTTHSINATARCDVTKDELMAMCAVRGGAPSRVR